MAGAGAPGDELLGLQQLAAHPNVIWGGPMLLGHHPGARWLTGARPKWLLGPPQDLSPSGFPPGAAPALRFAPLRRSQRPVP